MAKRPDYLQYSNGETPPPLSTAILALQHSAIVLVNLVYVVIITKALNFEAAAQFAMLSTTLLVCGLGTLLQAQFGSRLLVVFHPNPIYIPIVIAAGLTHGPGGIATLLVVAGLVQFISGSLFRKLRILFPPEVCGVVIIMLGISLLPGTLRGVVTQSLTKTFLHVEPAGLTVALVTLTAIAVSSVWLKGMARFFSLLIGCVAGVVVAYSLGSWHTGLDSNALDVPVFALPQFHVPGFKFDIGLVYLALVAALVNVVDEIGVLIGTERLDDADWRRPDFNRISKGLMSDGVFTAFSGVLGGVAMGMSSANLSLAYATGVTSRIVAVAAGAILVGVTFVPLALKHVLSLPDAVVAGILFYAACYFIVSGAELALSRLLSPRRVLVIGLSVGAGVLLQSVPALTTRFSGTSIEHVLAPMTFATILAIVLNLVMRIGIRQQETLKFNGPDWGETSQDVLETLGERWGLHHKTGTRATAAMREVMELLATAAKGPVVCTISYNEIVLVLKFIYDGRPIVLPNEAPDLNALTESPDEVDKMAGWIVRRFSDYSTMSTVNGKQQFQMVFEC